MSASPQDFGSGTPDEFLSSGHQIAGYTITRFLGRGAMGEVYEATYDETGEAYALKFLSRDMMGRESAVERFQREAEIMAALDHPHIAKVHDWGEEDGRHWLCIELLGGMYLKEGGREVTTLEDFIAERGGKLPQEEVQICMGQFLDALTYAHGKGLIHRDLKPANILLCDEGMKIADFGLVDAANSEWLATQVQATVAATVAARGDATLIMSNPSGQRTPESAMLGTFAYMSPEQKNGWPATEQSDLYAAGLVCFYMLTGQQSPGFEMPSEMDGSLWKGWDAFIRKSMKMNPEGRFPNAGAMSAALEEVEHSDALSGTTLASNSGTPQKPASKKSNVAKSEGVGGRVSRSLRSTDSQSVGPASKPEVLYWVLGLLVLVLTGWGVWQWWGTYSEKLEAEREVVQAPVVNLDKQKRELEKAEEPTPSVKPTETAKTSTPKEPEPALPPMVKKPSYLDFKHDPEKAPVPQPLKEKIIKVPPPVEQAIIQNYKFAKFPSLVDAVEKWTRIPEKIFPLEIAASTDLTFKVPDVTSDKVPLSIPAKTKIMAMMQRGSMLVVKPQRTSLYETQVPLFQTNVKDVVAGMYNRNVNAWFRHTLKLRNDARARYNAGMPAFAGGPTQAPATLAVSTPTPQATAENTVLQPNTSMNSNSGADIDPQYGPMPRMDGKGAILCAAASIRKNELKNCELQFVQRWGVPKKATLQGKKMWVVDVGYRVDSIFGIFPQEARAYIRNEKVEKWEVLDD